MGNYISIKEFSQMAKVSQQSIYKRMRKEDNPLNKFIKLGEKGKPVISTDALALYDKEKIIIDEAEPPAEKDNKPASNNIVNEVIEILREQLEEERKQNGDAGVDHCSLRMSVSVGGGGRCDLSCL